MPLPFGIWWRYKLGRWRSNPLRETPWGWLVLLILAPLVAHHYWHRLYPMHGITLLKIVGYAAIPLFLAIAGNHFAAEAIQNVRQKWMWRVIFIGLGLAGMIFVAVVEKEIDDAHEAEVTSLTSTMKQVLSEQNFLAQMVIHPDQRVVVREVPAATAPVISMNAPSTLSLPSVVLPPTQAASNAPAPTSIIINAEDVPPIPAPPFSGEPELHQMSNQQLKDYTKALANRMRDFENAFKTSSYTAAIPNGPADFQEQSKQIIQRNLNYENDWKKNFRVECMAVRAEVLGRLKAAGIVPMKPTAIFYSQRTVDIAIDNGGLYGPSPISDAADYLELAARSLP